MLHFEPTGIFSSTFRVRRGAREVTELGHGWFRETGSFEYGGQAFTLERSGWISGDFTLRRDGQRLAGAVKPSAFRSRFEVSCPEGNYVLRQRSVFGRAYELVEGRQVIGSVEPEGMFTRRGRARLPRELPFETSVFILWLVLLMWRRAERSNG